ncbi:hypothetical protein [Bacillus sp. FJAT-27251]|uniref:hypothetical protein n=1 Tax=Bacillus sp. FJAT-27251 TaxID=1684142 RepID=UPI0006A78D10|nr:hypothetical protein [Bacillus sp. FJAT-27251]
MNTPLSSISIEVIADLILECSQNQNESSELVRNINNELKHWVNSYIVKGELDEDDKDSLLNGIHEKLQIMNIWNESKLRRQFFNNLRVYFGEENYFYKLVELTYNDIGEDF